MRAKTLAMLAAGMLVLSLALAPVSSGMHVRPKGATPLRISWVIAYPQCTAATDAHNPPLAFPSCNPTPASSNFLTAGTPDANGGNADFVGGTLLQVVAGPNVNMFTNISGVRCMPGEAAALCSTANSSGPPDYSGQLQLKFGLRITDHNNAPGATATVTDFPFAVAVNCTPTASLLVGSNCNLNTTWNAITPGIVPGNFRTVYQMPQNNPMGGIQVFDGGANGTAGAADATLYLEPGLFAP